MSAQGGLDAQGATVMAASADTSHGCQFRHPAMNRLARTECETITVNQPRPAWPRPTTGPRSDGERMRTHESPPASHVGLAAVGPGILPPTGTGVTTRHDPVGFVATVGATANTVVGAVQGLAGVSPLPCTEVRR